MDGAIQGIGLAESRYHTTLEVLQPQTIEGVLAHGARIVTTLEAGAVGNDQEIVVTHENWISAQLHILVWTKLSDPRFGVTVGRLTNIKLAEPDPSLFSVPETYAIEDAPAQ